MRRVVHPFGGEEGDRKAMVHSQPLCKLEQWDVMARPKPREDCDMRLLALLLRLHECLYIPTSKCQYLKGGFCNDEAEFIVIKQMYDIHPFLSQLIISFRAKSLEV